MNYVILRSRIGILLVLLFSFPVLVLAQGTITGSVYDADTGDPLPGAQVIIPSINLGSVSNLDGSYEIENVPAGDYVLEARFIGYAAERQSISVVSGQSIEADFTMGAAAIDLDEVVVTGAGGPVEKRKLGNSISTINAASLQDAPVTNFSQVLQGREPGVVGLPSGGQTGEGARIRIRGSASLSQSNEPIVYIDGVRSNNNNGIGGWNPGGSPSRLDDINPEAIDRIEILKGAAAATLYGTEASNGVIQIFTKQGAIGAPRFNFQISQGASSYPDGVYPDNVGFARDQAIADTMSKYLGGSYSPYELVSINAMEDMYETGYEQIYSASVSGGSPGITYFVSMRWQDEDGPFGAQSRQYPVGVSTLAQDVLTRAQATASLNIFPTDKLQFRVNTTYTDFSQQAVDSNNNIYGVSSLAQFSTPDFIRFNNQTGTRAFATVNETLQQQVYQDVNRFVGSLGMNYRPLDMLTIDATFGADFTSQRDEDVRGFGWNIDGVSGSEPSGSRDFRNVNNLEITADIKGTLRNQIGGSFESTFLFGGQGFISNRTILLGQGRDFPGPGFNVTSAQAVQSVDESFSEVVNAGIFAQEQIGYNDFMFLTFGGRLDANSAFGSNFDAVFYPKVSLSFIPSDAPFWTSGAGPISSMRFRAAIGQSGLQPGAFDALTTYAAITSITGAGVSPDNLGNANLEPEISTEWELGAEFGLMNDRIGIETTYWNRVVKDALVARQFPLTGGFRATQLDNIGEIEGQGLELGVNALIYNSRDFSVNLFANAAYLWEQVTDLGGAPPIKVGGSYTRYRNYLIEGYSPGMNFGAKLVDVDPGFLPIDFNGDGMPDSEAEALAHLSTLTIDDAALPRSTSLVLLEGDPNPNDLLNGNFTHPLGKPTPDWSGSFGGSFKVFGDFTVSTLFEYKTGNYYVNNLTDAFRQSNSLIGLNLPTSARVWRDYLTGGVDASGTPQNSGEVRLEALREWLYENLALNPFSGLNHIKEADFLRWREISLTYRAPNSFVQNLGLRNLSLSIAARNLNIWTKYDGVDPELNAIGRGAGNSLDDNFLDGIEAFGFAIPRRILFTLRFGF